MSEPDLFSRDETLATKVSDVVGASAIGVKERAARVQRSALWAAYGDALGWISELTDAAGLTRRTGGMPLNEPVAWKRRIGGRSGVTVQLPRGCYSDDSQLRLATGRAIRSDGFDVEAFAKVELPVWLSYGLGGGRSTSAAATRLGNRNSTWWSNTFKGWSKSGGNGAAMRVQPHVWAARTAGEPESYLPDVVRNAVCTHSHPTGLMGAVMHALCVAHAMTSGGLPSPDDVRKALRVAEAVPAMIDGDAELGFWRTVFEQEAGNFDRAWADAVDEVREAIRFMDSWNAGLSGAGRYRSMVDGLKLRDPAKRGSGLLTALAATGLTWCEARPAEALRIAANAVGTDTDTIATMSGAILGVIADADPPVDVLDADLFRSEASRLAKIAGGGHPSEHMYPDLLHWLAPKARADALVRSREGGLLVRGLGRVTETLEEPISRKGIHFRWHWVRLESGQTLLIKSRDHIPIAIEERLTASVVSPVEGNGPFRLARSDEKAQAGGADIRGTARSKSAVHRDAASDSTDAEKVRDVVSFVEKHIGDDREVGRALRKVARKGTRGQIAAFTWALIDLLRDHSKPRESP